MNFVQYSQPVSAPIITTVAKKPINQEELSLLDTIKTIATETGHAYGKRRMHVSLLNRGFKIGLYRTATLMKKANVVAITPRKRHVYPKSGKPNIKAANILACQFYPGTINTHWVGDITYSVPGVQGKHGCLNEPRVYLKFINTKAGAKEFITKPGCDGLGV